MSPVVRGMTIFVAAVVLDAAADDEGDDDHSVDDGAEGEIDGDGGNEGDLHVQR